MDFWKSTTDAVTKAVSDLVEKNRRTAMINRLKIVVKNEKDVQNRAYAQLGKYYYQNLRDPQNGDTETYCAAIEKASARLGRAYAKLDELTVPAEACCCTAGQDAACDGDEEPETKPAEAEAPAAGPDSPLMREEPNPVNEEAADDAENPLDPFIPVQNDDSQKQD
jgi:type IV secretory pathway VirJ component